ncbi:hypothetical protein [Vibrio sp. 10N.239.312.D08]|uniref:hypothetical protein n=1 Tax=Vibrio sp. 10N.239.312.D08 TaxID=3229978 RepID=UPI00354EECB2
MNNQTNVQPKPLTLSQLRQASPLFNEKIEKIGNGFTEYVQGTDIAKILEIKDVNKASLHPDTWYQLAEDRCTQIDTAIAASQYGDLPFFAISSVQNKIRYADYKPGTNEIYEVTYHLQSRCFTDVTKCVVRPLHLRTFKSKESLAYRLYRHSYEPMCRPSVASSANDFFAQNEQSQFREDIAKKFAQHIKSDSLIESMTDGEQLCKQENHTFDHLIQLVPLYREFSDHRVKHFVANAEHRLNQQITKLGLNNGVGAEPFTMDDAYWLEFFDSIYTRYENNQVMTVEEIADFVRPYVPSNPELKAYQVKVLELFEDDNDDNLLATVDFTEMSVDEWEELNSSEYVSLCGVSFTEAISHAINGVDFGEEYRIKQIGPFSAEALIQMQKGEYDLENKGELARQSGFDLKIEIIESISSFFIGTRINGELISRESLEKYQTEAQAKMAYVFGSWTQRKSGQKPRFAQPDTHELSEILAAGFA